MMMIKKDKEVSKKEREKDQLETWKVVNDVMRVCVKVSEEHFSCLVFFRAGMDDLSCVFVLHFVYCKKILSMTLHSVVRYTLYDVR
jgi:hypothetical protein